MKETQKTGIYVHIPFCRSRCSYCGFVSCTDFSMAERYVAALKEEIRERANCEADTVYVGGGTPSALQSGLLSEIFDELRKCARLSENCEITVEANPDSCGKDFLREITYCGANRLSLGVQSLGDGILSGIGRRHNSKQARSAVERAQNAGITNISCDVMLGLPNQTVADVAYAVDELSSWGIKHISAYALSVEKGTALYDKGYSPNEDVAADMYEDAYKRLKAHGFERYEVSNFCKAGFESRHNLKYWRLEPYIGLGAAAHSYNGIRRSYNTPNIAQYVKGDRGEISEEISRKETLEEYVMLGLRTRFGILFSRLNELYGSNWANGKRREISELSAAGLITCSDKGITLTEKAYFVMNEIIVRLI